jgi:hypothetical protein
MIDDGQKDLGFQLPASVFVMPPAVRFSAENDSCHQHMTIYFVYLCQIMT